MTGDGDRKNPVYGVVLVTIGTLALIALAAFVTVAIGFRQTFSPTLPPFGDMIEGVAILSPVIIIALLLIGYGRHLLRRQ